MIRFLADENFHVKVIKGIRRNRPDADIVRVQDTIMYQAPDPKVLEWAAQEGRILLTHDVETMVGFANERIASGLPMPGMMVAHDTLPIAQVIEDLLTILGASEAAEWDSLVTFLPL